MARPRKSTAAETQDDLPARTGGATDLLARADKRELERWYPLRPHPMQLRLVEDRVRFKVVPAGRRSGKTERLKRFTVREALRTQMPYFLGAPTYAQARRIFWDDVKLLGLTRSLPGVSISESDLKITYPHGGSITVENNPGRSLEIAMAVGVDALRSDALGEHDANAEAVRQR